MIEAVNLDTPSLYYCADRFLVSSKWFHTRSNIWLHKPISQSPSLSCSPPLSHQHTGLSQKCKGWKPVSMMCLTWEPKGKACKVKWGEGFFFFFLIFIIRSWPPQASLFSFPLWINLLTLQLLAEEDQQMHVSVPFDLPGQGAGDVFICDLSAFWCLYLQGCHVCRSLLESSQLQ